MTNEEDSIDKYIDTPKAFIWSIINRNDWSLNTLPTLDKEDLFQEGWLALLQSADDWDKDRGTPFPIYAYVCVRNNLYKLINSEIEREKHKTSYDSDEYIKRKMGEEDHYQEEVEDEYEKESERIESLIEELPDRKAKALRMYIEGHTQEEIGQELDVTQQAISKLLNNL